MLDTNEKKILSNNYVLNKRKQAVDNSIFKGFKKIYFLLGIIIGFFILLILFFISDYSNIYHITVDGNVYLSDKDIIKIADISEYDKYLFVIPSFKEKNLTNSPYIESAKVEKLDDRVIKITVSEVKQVAYIYENGLNYILLANDTRVVLTDDNIYMTSKLPILEGFNETQITEILRGFKNLDEVTINQISEVHRYPFSYDENMMEIIMKDGNYVFVSWTGLTMLKNYYSIVSGLSNASSNICIYLDELNNSGYTSACPWQEDTTTSETESQETNQE